MKLSNYAESLVILFATFIVVAIFDLAGLTRLEAIVAAFLSVILWHVILIFFTMKDFMKKILEEKQKGR